MIEGEFNGYTIRLVQTEDDLRVLSDAVCRYDVRVGMDTETTGLSYVRDHVVGISIACGEGYGRGQYVGYYLPLRHYGYSHNLPVSAVIKEVQRIVDSRVTLWWNRSFDYSMLEKDGFIAPFVGGSHDIQMMAHEIYNEQYPSLKAFAKRMLKFQTISYEDTAAVGHDFGSVDPESGYIYAGFDAIMTGLLGLKIWRDYPQVHPIYALDNMCVEAVRRLTQEPIYLDYDYLDRELRVVSDEVEGLRQDIYRLVGYPFNVNSTRDVADALSRFVTLTVRTKNGFKVDKTVLSGIDHPLARLLLAYSARSTYMGFVSKMASWRGTDVRLNYNLVVALTGRMSSSGSEGNDYYKPYNGQNVPKVELKAYLHEDALLGYSLRDEREGCVEVDGKPVQYKTKGGLRCAFVAAPPGDEGAWVTLGLDYASEEIAVAANMSGEEGLLYPLKHGLDVHLYVADKMFGVRDPAFRSKSKAVSFGKLYGGGAHLIGSRLGITDSAAQELIIHYDSVMPRLKAWQGSLVKSAQRTGFARTYFGRSIYVGKWFNSPDRGLQGYAKRVSLNSPIQGCLPSYLYQEVAEGVAQPLRACVGQRVPYRDYGTGSVRQGVPTFRGKDELHAVLFNTGDFIVMNPVHKFKRYGDDVLLGLDDMGAQYVELVPSRRKSFMCTMCGLWCSLRGGHVETLESLASLGLAGRSVALSEGAWHWGLFRAFMLRKRYKTGSLVKAAVLRSLCDLFGYNLIYDYAHSATGVYVFKVAWGRSCKAKGVFASGLGVKADVVSPSMCTGKQVYPLAGFVHKNTGGDMIRRCLVKLARLQLDNAEFGANVKFLATIHDEVQVRVRRSYLQKALRVMLQIMNFWPSNFQTPVLTEPCVGWSQGLELDIDAVSEDGYIIPKGFTPPQSYIDAHPGWYYVDSWVRDEKLHHNVDW